MSQAQARQGPACMGRWVVWIWLPGGGPPSWARPGRSPLGPLTLLSLSLEEPAPAVRHWV